MTPEITPPVEPSGTTEISRRKLLKMLTAGAGASATVLLSSQWVKPVAAGGKLAPHAQVSQPTTHVIIRGSAQQSPNQQTPDLLASCYISAADPNIPMVATVNATFQPPTLAPAAPQVVVGSQTANTDGSGMASFTFPWDGFDPPLECNTTELEVVFSFANAADGNGTLPVIAPWEQPC